MSDREMIEETKKDVPDQMEPVIPEIPAEKSGKEPESKPQRPPSQSRSQRPQRLTARSWSQRPQKPTTQSQRQRPQKPTAQNRRQRLQKPTALNRRQRDRDPVLREDVPETEGKNCSPCARKKSIRQVSVKIS